MKKNENVWEQEQAGSSPYAYRALYINGDQLFERVRYRSNQESGGQKITKWKMNKEMEGLSLQQSKAIQPMSSGTTKKAVPVCILSM